MRVAVGLLCATVLIAGAPSESVSLYGIALGRPLNLPVCSAEYADVMCFGRTQTPVGANATLGPALFPAGVMPHVLRTREVDLLVIDGAVHAITLHTTGMAGQAEALKLLTEKFGKPRSLTTKQQQNAFGATFNVIEAAWRIGPAQVDLIGADGKADEGRITAFTPQAVRYWTEHLSPEPKL